MAKELSRKRRQGKKNRKHGRNLIKCEAYRRAHRRELNRDRRARRIIRGFRGH